MRMENSMTMGRLFFSGNYFGFCDSINASSRFVDDSVFEADNDCEVASDRDIELIGAMESRAFHESLTRLKNRIRGILR